MQKPSHSQIQAKYVITRSCFTTKCNETSSDDGTYYTTLIVNVKLEGNSNHSVSWVNIDDNWKRSKEESIKWLHDLSIPKPYTMMMQTSPYNTVQPNSYYSPQGTTLNSLPIPQLIQTVTTIPPGSSKKSGSTVTTPKEQSSSSKSDSKTPSSDKKQIHSTESAKRQKINDKDFVSPTITPNTGYNTYFDYPPQQPPTNYSNLSPFPPRYPLTALPIIYHTSTNFPITPPPPILQTTPPIPDNNSFYNLHVPPTSIDKTVYLFHSSETYNIHLTGSNQILKTYFSLSVKTSSNSYLPLDFTEIDKGAVEIKTISKNKKYVLKFKFKTVDETSSKITVFVEIPKNQLTLKIIIPVYTNCDGAFYTREEEIAIDFNPNGKSLLNQFMKLGPQEKNDFWLEVIRQKTEKSEETLNPYDTIS
ncbi:hypothetical protein ABK040_012098 [Willaertia magna]